MLYVQPNWDLHATTLCRISVQEHEVPSHDDDFDNNNNNNTKIYNAHMQSSIKHESEARAVARWPDGVY